MIRKNTREQALNLVLGARHGVCSAKQSEAQPSANGHEGEGDRPDADREAKGRSTNSNKKIRCREVRIQPNKKIIASKLKSEEYQPLWRCSTPLIVMGAGVQSIASE